MATATFTVIYRRGWNGYFARYEGDAVTVYKYAWMPWYFYHRFVIPHEIGHLSGIPATGCLGRHKWCVMAEEHLIGLKDGSFLGKLLLLPFQLIKGRGRHCEACTAVISVAGEVVLDWHHDGAKNEKGVTNFRL